MFLPKMANSPREGKSDARVLNSSIKSSTRIASKLDALEFYDCEINKPKTIKICIRNTSGVNTTFEIFSEIYKPFTT